MKKTSLPLASVTLVVLLSLGLSGSMPTHAEALTAKPNIVFILADDMRKDDLKYMPKTRNLLQEKGITFQNAFVSNALCCPSRATIMRGQYSHNTGVWTNHNSTIGGWQAYKTNGDEKDNVATRLDDTGYRTAFIGKYLNGYHHTTYVPPGWDRWFATFDPAGGSFRYYDYDINDNGTIRHYGSRERDYKTDVLSRKTNAFIAHSASLGKPFFAYVTPIAPHLPSIPAPRDAHTFDGLNAPRLPSFNERDVSDKPSWIRKLPRLTSDQITKIDNLHENRVESLQAVDDLVQGVVGKLKNAGVMSNTYVFFTSDNGWLHGEHRIPKGKARPYEGDVHMPLVVRGPGVAADSKTAKLALNTDYLRTFTNLAGAKSPPYVDGRSLRPVLKGNATTWRHAILLEAAAKHSPAYTAIRTLSTNTTKRKYERKYVEYTGRARELYKLDRDPYELANRYNAAKPPSGLASRLQALKRCSAHTCRAAEDGQ
jgi:N-acetylglucosamine-6-sulfatase